MHVGHHSVRALWAAKSAQFCEHQRIPIEEAYAIGRAHGHAFRAAELAYNLGFDQANHRIDREVVRLQAAVDARLGPLEDMACGLRSMQDVARSSLPLPVFTAMQAMTDERELRKHAALHWLGKAIESSPLVAKKVLVAACEDLLSDRIGASVSLCSP